VTANNDAAQLDGVSVDRDGLRESVVVCGASSSYFPLTGALDPEWAWGACDGAGAEDSWASGPEPSHLYLPWGGA